MSTSSDALSSPLPPTDADVWLLAAAEKHAAIHLKAAHPWNEHALHEAFTDMLVLLLEAVEEVRVMSAQLREESQAVRSKSIALRDHYAQLLEQSVAAMERLGQFIPPPPEEIRQAESRILEMFRAGNGREKQNR
jgi:hypothetical protein